MLRLVAPGTAFTMALQVCDTRPAPPIRKPWLAWKWVLRSLFNTRLRRFS